VVPGAVTYMLNVRLASAFFFLGTVVGAGTIICAPLTVRNISKFAITTLVAVQVTLTVGVVVAVTYTKSRNGSMKRPIAETNKEKIEDKSDPMS